MELASPWEAASLALKVGRQALSYGDQRFVGAFDWSNVARAFDAVKASWTPTTWAQVDGWFSQVVLVDRVKPDTADHSDNHGSGDDDADDGEAGNFDNLFPTNHLHYGYADLASLRNMEHVEVHLSAKPIDPVSLVAKYHWFFLDTNKSAWFNAGQGVIRAARAGASSTIGQEVDLLAKWKASPHLEALLGYSHVHAGAFLSDTGPADDAHFLYWQTTLSF